MQQIECKVLGRILAQRSYAVLERVQGTSCQTLQANFVQEPTLGMLLKAVRRLCNLCMCRKGGPFAC